MASASAANQNFSTPKNRPGNCCPEAGEDHTEVRTAPGEEEAVGSDTEYSRLTGDQDCAALHGGPPESDFLRPGAREMARGLERLA